MPCIAIDGPGGAGKSTVSSEVARRLGLTHLNSGAMYRAMSLHMMRAHVPLDDEAAIVAQLPSVDLSLDLSCGQRVLLCGVDVTDELSVCAQAASMVSKIIPVRRFVNEVLRRIAKREAVMVDGRDIGAEVLPRADLKIYLTADAHIRAHRRFLQFRAEGNAEITEEEVYEDLIRRDYADTHRAISPLRKAHDAVEVDCSHITQEETVEEILRLARRAGL